MHYFKETGPKIWFHQTRAGQYLLILTIYIEIDNICDIEIEIEIELALEKIIDIEFETEFNFNIN